MGSIRWLMNGLLTLLLAATAILGAGLVAAAVLWPLLMTHH